MMRISTLMFAGSLCLLPAVAGAGEGDLQDRFPDQFELRSTLTREQVRDEALAAIARGELPMGERGHVFKDEPSTRTRAEVIAEMREAARLGLLRAGEAGPPPITPAQQARIRAAGDAASPPVETAQKR